MWKVIKYSLRLSGWMGFAFCLLFAIGMVVFLMMTDQQKYLKALPSGISMAAFMMPYYVFRIADKRISNDCLYLPAKPTDKFFGFQVPAITTMLILFCTTLPLLTLSDIEKENMISGLLLTPSVWSLSLYSSFLKPLTKRVAILVLTGVIGAHVTVLMKLDFDIPSVWHYVMRLAAIVTTVLLTMAAYYKFKNYEITEG